MNELDTTTNESPHTPRRREVTWLLMFVMLFSGMVIGAGGAAIFIRGQLIAHIHEPEQMPQRASKMLSRRLDLSEAQAAEVEQILAYRQQELLEIRRQALPQVHAQLDLVEEEILAVLDPRQRAKFKTDFARVRETWVPSLK